MAPFRSDTNIMASSTPTNDPGSTISQSTLPESVRAGAFWLAVLLPFCSIAVLAGGVDTISRSVLFVGLVVGNVVALVLGHGYRR
jgi:hypothetical protein